MLPYLQLRLALYIVAMAGTRSAARRMHMRHIGISIINGIFCNVQSVGICSIAKGPTVAMLCLGYSQSVGFHGYWGDYDNF